MRLNEKELSVMEEVRDMMYMDAESDNELLEVSHYICSNIQIVLTAREGFDNEFSAINMTDESKEILSSLHNAVRAGICGRMSFPGYLRRHGPEGFALSSDDFHDQASILGRLAWLDKIVETGEIVSELHRLQKNETE